MAASPVLMRRFRLMMAPFVLLAKGENQPRRSGLSVGCGFHETSPNPIVGAEPRGLNPGLAAALVHACRRHKAGASSHYRRSGRAGTIRRSARSKSSDRMGSRSAGCQWYPVRSGGRRVRQLRPRITAARALNDGSRTRIRFGVDGKSIEVGPGALALGLAVMHGSGERLRGRSGSRRSTPQRILDVSASMNRSGMGTNGH
jgi:hypothetical protein